MNENTSGYPKDFSHPEDEDTEQTAAELAFMIDFYASIYGTPKMEHILAGIILEDPEDRYIIVGLYYRKNRLDKEKLAGKDVSKEKEKLHNELFKLAEKYHRKFRLEIRKFPENGEEK